MSTGYDFDQAQLVELLIRRFFPERTQRESTIIHDWLAAHGQEFDRFSFSVRVGTGLAADPAHLDGVQRNTVFSSKKRIDILAWQGEQPYIGEVKERINPQSLGQLLTYRHLWLEDHPDAREPRLFAIGRYNDEDAQRVLNAHGVDVFIYPPAGDGGPAAGGL